MFVPMPKMIARPNGGILRYVTEKRGDLLKAREYPIASLSKISTATYTGDIIYSIVFEI